MMKKGKPHLLYSALRISYSQKSVARASHSWKYAFVHSTKEPLQNINSAAAPFACLFHFRIRPHQPRLCFSRSSRTSRSVPSENASSVNASASGRAHREMARRMLRTEEGGTLKVSSPSDKSTGVRSGSDAASPHIPTWIPASLAQCTARLIDRSTAGSQ